MPGEIVDIRTAVRNLKDALDNLNSLFNSYLTLTVLLNESIEATRQETINFERLLDAVLVHAPPTDSNREG